MKKLLWAVVTIVVVTIAWTNAFATAQFGERLLYKDKDYSMHSNPLESYWNKNNPRPHDLFPMTCTACWRGYIGSWKIDEGYLYLTKLVAGTCSADAPEIPLSKIFPDRKAPVKATWFSGTLRIPEGKMLRYVHMGYGSVFEREIVLTIQSGKVVEEEIIDNTQKRIPTEQEKSIEELWKLKEWEDRNRPIID